jgi:hypothetical protein
MKTDRTPSPFELSTNKLDTETPNESFRAVLFGGKLDLDARKSTLLTTDGAAYKSQNLISVKM